ncbi:MAG: hypothetical protein GF355_11350 [Candidatus Eisenbacteria bacterium]|nr:hypothetical protein [Candidatus Eisenbacteria bacterium]
MLIVLYVTTLVVSAASALEFTDDFEDGDLDGWQCPDDWANWLVTCGQPDGSMMCLLPFEQQVTSSLQRTPLSWVWVVETHAADDLFEKLSKDLEYLLEDSVE